MHADRLSNPSSALRREAQAHINDIPLAHSLIPSSAPDSYSNNSTQSSRSSRNSIPKGFHDITDKKQEKGKLRERRNQIIYMDLYYHICI